MSQPLAMAFCDKEYFEKIGELQQNLHDSEKRRFELERELLGFGISDHEGSQIKSAKLRCYLKQICEREKQAKARNLELLRHMERIELHMKALCLNYSALHQNKGKALQGPAASDSSSHLATSLYHPATVFMGRQTPGASPVEARATRATSDQTSAAKPNRFSPPPSLERWPEREHGRGGHRTASTPRAALAPCDLDGVRGRAAAHGRSWARGSQDSGGRRRPAWPFERRGGPRRKCSRGGSSPKPTAVKERQAADNESCSLPSSSAEKSVDCTLSSGSELPLSLSEGGDLAGSPRGGKGSDTSTGASHGGAKAPEQSKDAEKSEVGRERHHGRTPSLSKATGHTLSLEGFSRLLESIEERLDERGKNVYGISSVSEQRLSRLISLCNRKARLSDEDLEDCGAVALHQLQRLSWSTSKGCLLPRETVSANWKAAMAEESRIRACLSADGAKLWERWFKHAVVLRERGVYTADSIARLFTPSLVEKGASYIHEAEALLRALLEEATGGALSVESDESSSGLPSFLLDGGEIRAARPAHRLDASVRGKQGQQSGEEDSREESFVEESIPIRETKAYQLLKQSAAQQRPQSTQEDEDEEDDEDGLDVFPPGGTRGRYVDNAGKDETTRTSSSSFREGPRAGAGKATKGTVPAVQSKAFWGESDDSSSDVEAALRPQSRATPVDDFDYFYD
ncbi:hypothetical protein AAFF_G00069020 [Aldrovandia affinis]|uniref:Centrosomal protein kizuna n=1 Tax=Aldrovandia affinis TaxID=143900 RepID=A0AAD7WDR5_9TELE|nr:hypothetical protein AAFF_G00069020 [Aldrovandia affinis]